MIQPSWQRRAIAAIPWIKRLVFVSVLIGLIFAGIQAITRWQTETAALRSNVQATLVEASKTDDLGRRTRLTNLAARQFESIPSLRNLKWAAIGQAGVFYSLGLLPPCWILFRCLAAIGAPCSLPRATLAQLLGHAGKYIPGKALVVLLRVGTITPATGFPKLVTAAVFYETLLMMGVGGVVAGVLLWNSELPSWVRTAAAFMAIVAVVPVCPPIMRRLISKLQKNLDDDLQLTKLHWGLFVESFIASLISWLLIGASFACLIEAIPTFELELVTSTATVYWNATAAIALGMVLGFASLLPGGAGVREFATLLILTPVIGTTHALLAVIAARLMFILVESVLAGVAWLLIQKLRTRSS